MVSALNIDDFGERLAALRREQGFRTTDELAAAMPDSGLTAAVLRNVESGRKRDVTALQLLDLAQALNVPPIVLLVPLGRPYVRGLPIRGSEGLVGLTAVGLERLLTGAGSVGTGYGPTVVAIRDLHTARASRRLIRADLQQHLLDPTNSLGSDGPSGGLRQSSRAR